MIRALVRWLVSLGEVKDYYCCQCHWPVWDVVTKRQPIKHKIGLCVQCGWLPVYVKDDDATH